MPYDVFGVYRFVVNYSNEKDYNISHLKLHKLLYFIQAYFLVEKRRPCFEDDFEAWDFGPAIPRVYKEFAQYGGCNIPKIIDGRIGNEIKSCKFDPNDEKDIKEIVDVFSGYTATALYKLISYQGPWKDCYMLKKNNVITKEAIINYYSKSY